MLNDEILNYAAKRIRFRANQMVGKHGFTEDDFKDMCQALMCDVLRRVPKFDDSRADIKIFISTVIDNGLAAMIKYREAKRRDHRREERALDEPVPDEDGEWTTFGETISEEEARSRLGRAGPTDLERADLAMDVAVVLAQLDETDRQLCLDLRFMTPSEVSREKGISRSFIYKRIADLRRKFVEAGLGFSMSSRTHSPALR